MRNSSPALSSRQPSSGVQLRGRTTLPRWANALGIGDVEGVVFSLRYRMGRRLDGRDAKS